MRENKLENAIEALKEAARYNPLDMQIHENLAECYGDKKQKINYFKKMLTIDPNHIETYRRIGNLYAEEKNYQEAEYWFVEGTKHGDSITLLVNMGDFYVKINQLGKAKRAYLDTIKQLSQYTQKQDLYSLLFQEILKTVQAKLDILEEQEKNK